MQIVTDNTEKKEDISPDIVVLKFADSRVPLFKETRNKDYIKYGDDNAYPEYLTYLFNKSAKHNAILDGKAKYIFGKGYENGNKIINRLGESLNDVIKRAVLDIEVYGGFRLETIWDYRGKIAEIYHVDYSCIRLGKEGGYYYKEAWNLFDKDMRRTDNTREEEIFVPAFDPNNPVGSQIYAYNEYRPMVRYYPLPSYIGCNNYVETDIEISKYYLSAIRNGMMPSKMVQFYQGEPSEDKKREIEKRFANKFAGAENAGKFVLVFNTQKDKQVDISDLSASEVDKQFVELNKTCQQEIFSGHQVTSPMLFGIKTEGQLGGVTELRTAYEIFINTYAKPKAIAIDKEMEYLLKYSYYPGEYELQQTDPIGWQIPDEVLKQAITPDEARMKLGLEVVEKPVADAASKTLAAISGVSPLVATKILDNLTKNEIRGLAALPPVADGDVIPDSTGGTIQPTSTTIAAPSLDSDEPVIANDNIKNLTAKQHQQLMRIIRQYSKGQLTELAAKALLRTGLGLSESDINDVLGIEPPTTEPDAAAMAAAFEEQEDEIIGMFDACGDSRNDFEILKSKKVSFNSEMEAEEDETIYIHEAFKTYDITATENKILELIKKDSRITPDVIATTIKETKKFVETKISNLVKRGYLETSIEKIGEDEIIKRIVPKGLDIIVPPVKGKIDPVQVYVKYSYEGPVDNRNRPFCAKMMSLNRLYSRAEIESISKRLGYSVFDRRGGWWTKPNGEHSPSCRHHFKSHIVVKKK